MPSGIFDLDADPAAIDRASAEWTTIGTALTSAVTRINTQSSVVVSAGWEGDTADSYDEHRGKLTRSLADAATTTESIQSRLGLIAGTLRAAQGQLDTQWGKVAPFAHGVGGDDVEFITDNDADQQTVDTAIAAAHDIRKGADASLSSDAATLRGLVSTFTTIASSWSSVASDTTDGWDVPDIEQGEPGVITVGDQTIITGGDGDDDIKVYHDPYRGDQIVEINGQVYRIPAGQEIVVRGGGGTDTIEVSPDAKMTLTLLGSEGDDTIRGGTDSETILGLGGNDTISGGQGNDRISGGGGRDYLDGQTGDDTITGGEGNDTVYGLDGDDTLGGGTGDDYLEGGEGNDAITGGTGDDIVSGGNGDDNLYGGEGDDVTYAGRGDDTVHGGTGNDTSHVEDGDTTEGTEQRVKIEIPDTAKWIKIEGSSEFVARVQADLDMLASSPRGQQMLLEMQRLWDDSGPINHEGLTIKELHEENGYASNGIGDWDNTIQYNPEFDTLKGETPPVAVLYHEMAHVYDYMSDNFDETHYSGDDTQDHGYHDEDGNWVPLRQGERVASGLPVDHDHDPSTPEIIDPDHPYELTENGLREEMGWENRDHYLGQ